jgi:deoxyribose-phosphate aldolase
MEMNKYIDHTFLKATGQKADIDKLLSEAKQFNFASVCVNTS